MHRPVLLKEAVELLAVRKGGTYIDGTVGAGGHAAAILEAAGSEGFLLGIDRDGEAIERARTRLAAGDGRFALKQGNFAGMADMAAEQGIGGVDGILLDLGVSSYQLDNPERGFSFMHEGPLDMRMDAGQGATAYDLVNGLPEDQIASLVRELGEEPKAGRIARAIVRERVVRPIRTTGELARIAGAAAGGRRGRIHPATRTFQAFRMAVNHELDSIRSGLEAAVCLMVPGGRMAVISFHSLEDRIVKQFFAGHAGRWESLQQGGRRWVGRLPPMRLINRKPVLPSDDEVSDNPRARSAKLRVAERVAEPVGDVRNRMAHEAGGEVDEDV